MAEGSETPNSTLGKHASLKDKQCPWCHQPFTSSSLGRHLDLYIREKNPKAPDDVHDIAQIRKLRGSITRRQVRSSTKREASTPSTTRGAPSREGRSPSSPNICADQGNPRERNSNTFDRGASWHATGVINDLPTPHHEQKGAADSRSLTAPIRNGLSEKALRRLQAVQNQDRAQAAELALKEVLENVKIANVKAHPPLPFEYNFFGLSLPQMYLQCLSPPLELLAGPHSQGQSCWSLDPPGVSDYEVLRCWLSDQLHSWRRRFPYAQNGDTVNGAHGPRAPGDQSLSSEEALYHAHLAQEHQKWATLFPGDRERQWQHECARAFAREREQHSETTRKLEQAEHELRLLRHHLSQTSTISHPPYDPNYAPSPLPLSQDALAQLTERNKLDEWDYDSILQKWRTRIQSARSTQLPLPPHSPWPPPIHRTPYHDDSSSRYAVDTHSPLTGPPQIHTDPDRDEEGELEDAMGEDEDYSHDNERDRPFGRKMSGSRAGIHSRNGSPQVRGSRRPMGLGIGPEPGTEREAAAAEMDVESG